LNSYAGPKAHKIGNIMALQNSQHFYAKPTGVHVSENIRIAQSGTFKESALSSLQPGRRYGKNESINTIDSSYHKMKTLR